MSNVSIGIDIAKDSFDVHNAATGDHWTGANDSEGIDAAVERLAASEPVRIVMEATGGMEMQLAAALSAAGLPVAIVNPRNVRAFARSTGRLAKTDAIDAEVIARFADKVEPACRPLPDENERSLRQLIARRRQLVDMRTMETNRQRRIISQQVAESLDTHIAYITREIKDIDREIKRLIKASPVWRAKEDLLKSVPGIGDETAAMLVASLPELGTLGHRQIAALVGLAPMNCDSGNMRGRRKIKGGRTAVRTNLYIPTLSAIRCNPLIKQFYNRLRRAGKNAKVAITACMRKLLIILNAIIRDDRPWQPILP